MRATARTAIDARYRGRHASIAYALGMIAALLAMFGGLAFTAAPALALGALEQPVVNSVEPITATTATFNGTLQPHAGEPTEAGTYKYLYNAGAACTAGLATTPGISFGEPGEMLPAEPVSGLASSTEYTVCLSVTNPKGTEVSTPVTFETAPEAPESKVKVGSIAATSVEVEGVLDPKATKASEPGEYQFLYKVNTETECEGESAAPEPAGAALGHFKEAVTEKLTKLQPDQNYTFCLRESNAAGELGVGTPVTFKTLAAPPTIVSESVSARSKDSATLAASINPNNQVTEYSFEYSTSKAAVEGGTATKLPGAPPAAPLAAELNEGGVGVSVGTGAVLTSGKTYYYRVIAKNVTGKEEGKVEEFTTATPPEKPVTEAGTGETAFTVTLHGELNPTATGEVVTGWHFLYSTGPTCAGGTEAGGEAPTEVEPKAKVQAEVTGLEAQKKYVFCLVATNAAEPSETAQSGNEVTFTTLPAPPKLDSEGASGVTPTGATLEAQVNPNNGATKYVFEYATNEALTKNLVKGHVVELAAAGTDQTASFPTGAVLKGGTTYFYRVVVENEQSRKEVVKAVPGEVKSFTTTAPLQTPASEEAKPIAETTATLRGVLSPSKPGKSGTYEFLYRQSSSGCEGEGQKTTPQEGMTGSKGQAVAAEISELEPGTQYTFCLLARNNQGETVVGSAVTFRTMSPAPEIKSESAATVEATAATLEAEIVPGATTTYHFEYDTRPYNEGEAAHGTSVEGKPASPLGAGVSPAALSAKLTGLQSGSTYYYRLVASNECKTGEQCITDGPGKTFTTPETSSTTNGACPNAKLRTEQPFGLTLPDCRAYEMVSPVNTGGLNATEEEYDRIARAAEEGAPAQPAGEPIPGEERAGAVTYAASGPFSGTSAESSGATAENQYVSRRDPEDDGWSTQAITPLHEPDETETGGSYQQDAFDPQLTEGIAQTNSPFDGARKTETVGPTRELGLYVANFANSSYQYITEENNALPLGVSSDLSHVVFGQFGVVSEWAEGAPSLVGVDNGDELVPGAVAGWHAVSGTGSDVAFMRDGQLYVRVKADRLQSPVAQPEAEGSGTVRKGSTTVSELTVASGSATKSYSPGTTEVEVNPVDGRFLVGQPVSGSGIEAGTTITAIDKSANPPQEILTLSKPTAGEAPFESLLSSGGPVPFVVGDRVSGAGVPVGATVTAVADGSLTLSAAAVASEAGEQLVEGGGCTVSTDACTVEASAPQRQAENPAGQQPARYWGASADGSRTFFTSNAELTEDAYTGPQGSNAADLYEYDIQSGKLTDLTVDDEAATDGAAVQGVVQISEDASYLYFVAKGVLSGANAQHKSPTGGAENLYVSHEGRISLIATLGGEDGEVWDTSPETNLASVSPSGQWLAFLSKENLTGYDNDPARAGECQGEISFTNQNENGHCQEAYLYDAESDPHQATLVCASCNPTGARPVGPANLGEQRASRSLYRPRVVTNEGRLFFASYDKLVPGANGLQSVYEYEDGHLQAISDVSGANGSFLLDVSASGGDVFFASADRLLPEDPGSDVVVWDARVDGGFPVANPASCQSGESCKPPPTPQPSIYGAPASATFSGAANPVSVPTPAVKTKALTKAQKLAAALEVCRRDRKKVKRLSCERQARSRYGSTKKKAKSKKAKKSSNDRRAT